MVQGSQTALANGRGRLDERLARWLLMWHDRLESNEFPTTHELLALLLGVRRAGVTVALHELEGRGLIRSLRGRIRIVDRLGLQLAASGFYGIPECEYERSIGFASGKAHQVLPVACDWARGLAADGRRRATSSVRRPCEKIAEFPASAKGPASSRPPSRGTSWASCPSSA